MTFLKLYEEQTQTVMSAWIVSEFVYPGYSIKSNSVSGHLNITPK